MNLLAIDTATEALSVALHVNGNLFSRFEICPQQHSQKLLPLVDEVLQEAGVQIGELDGLVFGRGPGSFTGVRIATGMIQGLSLGSNLPVVGISTLQAMAMQAVAEHGAEKVLSATDARMSEVYFGQYTAHNGLVELVGEEVVWCASRSRRKSGSAGFCGGRHRLASLSGANRLHSRRPADFISAGAVYAGTGRTGVQGRAQQRCRRGIAGISA